MYPTNQYQKWAVFVPAPMHYIQEAYCVNSMVYSLFWNPVFPSYFKISKNNRQPLDFLS